MAASNVVKAAISRENVPVVSLVKVLYVILGLFNVSFYTMMTSPLNNTFIGFDGFKLKIMSQLEFEGHLLKSIGCGYMTQTSNSC